jgi:hypothetical protein
MERNHIFAASVAVVGLFVATPVLAAAARPQCALASLSGGFGVTLKGALKEGGDVAGVGQVTFDGKGGFTVQGASSRNGQLAKDVKATGRYTLAADCSGQTTLDGGGVNLVFPSGYFVFAPGAGELRLVAQDASVMANLIAKRQFSGAQKPCSVAAANGRFISSGEGPILGAGAFAAVGMIVFDGHGGLQVRRTLNYSGEWLPDKEFKGQYELNAHCYGEIRYVSEKEFAPVAATTFDTLVVDDDGREVRILSANPGRVLTVSGLLQTPVDLARSAKSPE